MICPACRTHAGTHDTDRGGWLCDTCTGPLRSEHDDRSSSMRAVSLRIARTVSEQRAAGAQGVLFFDRRGHGGPHRQGLGDLDHVFMIDLARLGEDTVTFADIEEQILHQHVWARQVLTPRVAVFALLPAVALIASIVAANASGAVSAEVVRETLLGFVLLVAALAACWFGARARL